MKYACCNNAWVALVAALLAAPFAASAGPVAVGPLDPATGYPIWYQDSNGLALELCDLNDGSATCLLDPIEGWKLGQPIFLPDPPDTTNPAFNWGGEAFWYAADASIDLAPGGVARLIVAIEAAFFPEVIARENAISFGRIRFDIRGLQPGTYWVTHPYSAEEEQLVLEEGDGDRIFVTEDIGGGARDFSGTLQSRVGPFLTPAGGLGACGSTADFIGDGGTECEVTGSAFGNNRFRIRGPGIVPEDPDHACPDQPTDCAETRLFTLVGKIARKFGAGVTRASYTRGDWDPGIEVFAFSKPPSDAGGDVFHPAIPEQVLAVSVNGGPPTPMATDGKGRYFQFIAGDFDPDATTVTVANTTLGNIGDGAATAVSAGVSDTVTIHEAYFYRVTPPNTLEIVAASSDAITPGVTLTAYDQDRKPLGGNGILTPGPEGLMLVLTDVLVPPAYVTVESSRGGSTTQTVDIGICERAGTSQQCVPPPRAK